VLLSSPITKLRWACSSVGSHDDRMCTGGDSIHTAMRVQHNNWSTVSLIAKLHLVAPVFPHRSCFLPTGDDACSSGRILTLRLQQGFRLRRRVTTEPPNSTQHTRMRRETFRVATTRLSVRWCVVCKRVVSRLTVACADEMREWVYFSVR
jgi:hypothetical protein